jgi:hypothetical protein
LTEKRLRDNLLPCGDRIHGVTGGLGTVENSNVSLLYSDEKYEIWIDNEKDNITLSMADRGITILFTRDEWQEFQEVIGNIMLEEEEEEAEET